MSKIDDADLRVGLGWEVWFLLAILAGGSLAIFVGLNLIGIGLDSTDVIVHAGPGVDADPRRLLVGGSVAIVFATLTARLVRSIDT